MKNLALLPALLVALALAISAPFLSAQDGVEDVLRRGYELPLRWDNVERAPEWVSGVEPQPDIWERRHSVVLDPGQSICVRVPAYEFLRVFRGGQQLSPDHVEIAFSTGSGLLAFTDPVPGVNGQSLLADPQRPYAMLAHVFRPAHFDHPIRLSLFTSRHVPLRDVASYRDLIDLGPKNKVRLTASVNADWLAYWRWNRGDRVSLRLRGPARFLVETRYRYPPHEHKLPQTYHLRVRDEDSGELLASLEYATSHETAHVVCNDGLAQVVSRLEPAIFELIDDRVHNITLETCAPVFVRVLRMEEPDYLVPPLNAPDPRAGDVAHKLRPHRLQHTPWTIPERRLRGALREPLRFPAEQVERAAMRLARDNGRREGGMMASGLLWNAGAPARAYPDIRERWREFVGFRTYYRDALPEGDCLAALHRSYFPARRLQELGKFRDWLVLADQHLDAGFSRLPLATFAPLQNQSAVSTYRLPARATHSIIRIAAERDRDRAADFWVRLAGENPRRFRLLPQPEVPWRETKPNQGEAALTLIEGHTLDAPISLRRESNNLVRAGYFEFMIPPHVRRLSVWGDPESGHLPVAVSYRASDVFELSEDEYAAMVSKLGGHHHIFHALARFLANPHVPSPERGAPRPEQELWNHWEPLRRFVRSRYRQFVDSVAPSGSMEPTAKWLAESDRLVGDGEFFLAERLARYLYLYARDDTIRAKAFTRLGTVAGRHLEPDRAIMNACVAMVEQPDSQVATTLCQLLRAAGEDELALMLALALPANPETRDLRLACTFAKSWWWHLLSIVHEKPTDPVCRVWHAHYLWRRGHEKAARREMEKAGEAGAAWLAHLDRTSEARRLVLRGERTGLTTWARSEALHPAQKIWKPVTHEHMRNYRAGVTLRALEREKYFHAFIATPGAPLELSFASPQKLRIECRPIHRADSTNPIEGWITVESNGGLNRKLPVITNYRSPGLEIVGRNHEGAGTLVWDEFALNTWTTRLAIRPGFGPILVRVLSEEPEVRTGHLPALGYETAAALFDPEHLTPRPDDHGFGAVCFIDAENVGGRMPLDSPFANPSARQIRSVTRVMSNLLPVPRTMSRPEQRTAIDAMTELLWTREHSGLEGERHAVAAASSELVAHRDVPELKRIHAKIVRRTFWEPLLAAGGGALREIEIPGWNPENPDLQTRMRLLPGLGLREQLISGTDSTVVMLTNKEDNTIDLRLRLAAVPYLVPKPLKARFILGEQAPREVLLTSGRPEQRFAFTLPAGRTSLRIEVLESEPNHFLRVYLDADKDRDLFERKTRRNYLLATQDEPLSIRVDGPSWVRLDRHAEHATPSDFRFVRETVETLQLTPPPSEQESLHRVHVLRLDENKPFHPPAFTERLVETVPPPLAPQPLRPPAALIEYEDEFHLGAQEDGTWTLGLSYHSRRAVEEDSFGGREPERFWQADLTHRYYDEPLRTYFRTTALLRIREYGEETYGLEHSLQHRPFDHPLTYTLTGRAHWQDGDWSLYGRGSVSFTQRWAPKWSHTPSASLFARALSRDNAGSHPERVDQDIFTRFKSDHRRGLRLRDEVSYTPWRDTRFFGGAGVGTNENFVSIDSMSYWAGVKQLLGPVQLGAKLQGYRFFEDDDRNSASWQHRLTLEATGDLWFRSQDRLEVGVNWTHFVEQDENAFFIFGRWHFGEGRMFRDFRPGEKPFLGTRDRRIPHDRNNAVDPRYHPDERGYRGDK